MAEVKKTKADATVDGVRAIELYYRPVKRISNGTNAFYQTQMRLNSPSLGTLLPENFLTVAEGSEQCTALFRLAFVQLLRSIQGFEQKGVAPEFISLYMPVRFLLTDEYVGELIRLCGKFEISPDQIAFEVSSDLLFEKDATASAVLATLSNEGFRFILSGFGSAGCPIAGLAPYPMDYVILDELLCANAGRGERENACVKSLVTLASQLGSEIIVPPILDREREHIFSELGCIYALSADFMSGRYAFRKKAEK